MTRFVILGRTAVASDDFLLDDVPGTSGRLDVGLRCVRAALLVSHGLRRDVIVYLVLGGGPRGPRTLRIRGDEVKFLRPDERSLAVLARKVLASRVDEAVDGFHDVKPGVAVARGGVDAVLATEVDGAALYLLDEQGEDLRQLAAHGRAGGGVGGGMGDGVGGGVGDGVGDGVGGGVGEVGEAGDPGNAREAREAVFFLGDPGGFDDATRAAILARGARPVSVGPVSLHSEDVVTLVTNELDRRFAGAAERARLGL